ncbi:MAG: hypothetical protein J6R94_03840 [Agathobacter sp.]|nr:hypothetical protein [Agathobacter sp.]
MSKWTKLFVALVVCIVFCVIVIQLWPKDNTKESKDTEAREDTNVGEDSEGSLDTEFSVEVTPEGIRIQETNEGVYFSEGPSGYDLCKFSADDFTGTYVIFSEQYSKDAWIVVWIYNFQINSGELHYYVKIDGEIIGELQPNTRGEAQWSKIFDEPGTLELVLVGKDADFSFKGPKEL